MKRWKHLFGMKRLGTTSRIALAMSMWSASMLLVLRLFGCWDDGHQALLTMRTRLCEGAAISCSQFISRGDLDGPRIVLETLAARNFELLSAGCRLANGELLVEVNEHQSLWRDKGVKLNRISVPIFSGADLHSHLEVIFPAPVSAGLSGILELPTFRVTLAATVLNLLGFSWWLRRCFRHLDPSQAVPDRVRTALDTMAEVVLVVDNKGQIMLANRRFSEILETTAEELQGMPLDQLAWQVDGQRSFSSMLEVVTSSSCEDVPTVKLRGANDKVRVFKPNASRILDEGGTCRGFLLCLDDITLIEEKNAQLRYLATRDPMTGCYNRRSFFEQFETLWKSSARYGHPLSCLMVDVDHFKSINDRFGHGVGDDVLKGVAQALMKTSRDTDFVCRYGGEEFCVLLPHVDIAGAKLAGERFRQAIVALEFPNLKVTASLGCADRSAGAEKKEAMLEQADQALYHAKRNGRNQVVRFDEINPLAEESAILEHVQELKKVVSTVEKPRDQQPKDASSITETTNKYVQG